MVSDWAGSCEVSLPSLKSNRKHRRGTITAKKGTKKKGGCCSACGRSFVTMEIR